MERTLSLVNAGTCPHLQPFVNDVERFDGLGYPLLQLRQVVFCGNYVRVQVSTNLGG